MVGITGKAPIKIKIFSDGFGFFSLILNRKTNTGLKPRLKVQKRIHYYGPL